MIKLFLYPKLLYPSYWVRPDGPAALEQQDADDELSASLEPWKLASGGAR
jgi:hypothetical protein